MDKGICGNHIMFENLHLSHVGCFGSARRHMGRFPIGIQPHAVCLHADPLGPVTSPYLLYIYCTLFYILYMYLCHRMHPFEGKF
jgi:hypothetical protein